MDFRDWFIASQVLAAWLFGTVYVFQHPSDAGYVTWCGLCGTLTGVYHWLVIRDSKEHDA